MEAISNMHLEPEVVHKVSIINIIYNCT